MNPQDPQVKERQVRLANLLNRGWPVADVAREIGVSKKRVYDYANRWRLPLNPPIKEGSLKEREIIGALAAGYSTDEVSRLYRVSPVIILKITSRMVEEIEEQRRAELLDGGGGHP